MTVTACNASTAESIIPSSESVATDIALAVIETATGTPTRTPTHLPSATNPSVATETAIPPTQTWEPTPFISDGLYRVIYVERNDVLNVRSGAGVENEIVDTIPYNAHNIEIIGEGLIDSGSIWVPIRAGQLSGWVNSQLITTAVEPHSLCNSQEAAILLESFKTAVATRDDARLAQLIHPERGLRIRHNWWNLEVRFRYETRTTLFSSHTDLDWGVADGSGEAMIGSFSQIILPKLETHFLGATATACNNILHGGSAGSIILPDGYEQHAYISYFQPGTEANGRFDWGTWVIGFETWQGGHYISYLVFYEWEI